MASPAAPKYSAQEGISEKPHHQGTVTAHLNSDEILQTSRIC